MVQVNYCRVSWLLRERFRSGGGEGGLCQWCSSAVTATSTEKHGGAVYLRNCG